MIESPDVAFLMVTTNDTKLEVRAVQTQRDGQSVAAVRAQEKLDGIRVQRQKFVCLNDNLQHTDNHSRLAVATLHEFYEGLFPLKSSFELPDDAPNAGPSVRRFGRSPLIARARSLVH